MKRIMTLSLMLIMIFSLIACSPAAKADDHVRLILPASIMGDATDEDLEAMREDEGVVEVNRKGDDGVEVVLTKESHEKTLAEMKQGVDEMVESILEGENAVTSFKQIDYKDDMSEFTVLAKKDEFSEWDTFGVIGFYMTGAIYQVFNGVPIDDVDVIVKVLDIDTKEEITRGSYKEIRDAQLEGAGE